MKHQEIQTKLQLVWVNPTPPKFVPFTIIFTRVNANLIVLVRREAVAA